MKEELFVKKNEFEKIASKLMSRDAGKWTSEVITHFHSEFPELAAYPVRLNFKQKNPDLGYGIGSLVVNQVNVPVIIEKFELYPLDVAILNGNTVPLNRESLRVLFSQKGAFSQVVSNDGDGAFKLNRVFSPELAEIQEKRAEVSMLDLISDKITKEAQQKALKELKELDFDLSHPEIYEKIAGLTTESSIFEKNAASKYLDRDIFLVTKIADNEYRVKLGNSKVDDVVEIDLNENQVETFYNSMSKHANCGKSSKKMKKMKKILEDKKNAVKTAEVDVAEPQVGDYGYFEIGDRILEPFNITKVAKINGEYTIEGTRDLQPVKFQVLKGIEQEVQHEKYAQFTYLPKTAKYCKCAKKKIEDLEYLPTHSIMTTDGERFNFSGPEFRKYAQLGHNIENLSLEDAKWVALQNGVDKDELNKIALKKGQKYLFESQIQSPISMSDYLAETNEKIAGKFSIFDDVELNLLKEAAVLDNQTTVDSILSLKFLNKENLQDFIMNIPMFENSLMLLARTLIMVRLGLKSIPEVAVKRAMDSLSIVLDKFYELNKIMAERRK